MIIIMKAIISEKNNSASLLPTYKCFIFNSCSFTDLLIDPLVIIFLINDWKFN